RGRAAHDEIDLVVVDQAACEAVCLGGVAAVVVVIQAQGATEHAAFSVQLVDIQLQRLQFRCAQICGSACHGKYASDLDRFGVRNSSAHDCRTQQGSGDELDYPFHYFHLREVF